jgi:hypothetical protein
LRDLRVQEFEGHVNGEFVRIKFALSALLPERQARQLHVEPAKHPEAPPPVTKADMLRARLGTIDEVIAADIGDA